MIAKELQVEIKVLARQGKGVREIARVGMLAQDRSTYGSVCPRHERQNVLAFVPHSLVPAPRGISLLHTVENTMVFTAPPT
jgi:hypothetical protein